jgi:pyruvate dehydrogenase E2 component (dihydrolipoamide acetyltransferase)
MRKNIARAMIASLKNMAQLTHHMSFDASEIMNLRKKFKERGAAIGMEKVTLNDMVLFAVARALSRPAHNALNAHLIDDKMLFFSGVHLGVAVDTERGLMVPTLFDADKLSLKDLSNAVKKLAAECQSGAINPDLLRGGSFTVSNLGALGVEHFTPVINPPQTGILGVCAITAGIREQNGALVSYPKMGLSLTYDHRALDGAPASRFLRELADDLESFTLTLIGD